MSYLDEIFKDVLETPFYKTYISGNKIKSATYQYCDDGLKFEFVVPGIDPKAIKVKTEDNHLSVSVGDEKNCESKNIDLVSYFECPNMRKIEKKPSVVKLALGVLTILFPYAEQSEEEKVTEYEITVE